MSDKEKVGTENDVSGENIGKEGSDVDDKDPTMHSITFGSSSSWPDSICWSPDDRIGVLTDKYIYILKISSSSKRKRFGASLGMQLEYTYIETIPNPVFGNISFEDDRTSKKSLALQQALMFDRSLVKRDHVLSLSSSYCSIKWSPLGCTSDGRCVLATLTASGVVRIHSAAETTGKWYVCMDITTLLFNYLVENKWLICESKIFDTAEFRSLHTYQTSSNCKVKVENKDYQVKLNEFLQFSHRKHLLFATAICWCPILWHCHNCLSSIPFDNIYYSSYFLNYAKCEHANVVLVTASKNGYIFVWKLKFNVKYDLQHKAEILHYWHTGFHNPSSLAWYQITDSEAFVAVGFVNGLIRIYRLSINVNMEGNYYCHCMETIEVWNEEDMVNVSFVSWISPMDSLLTLICAKGTEVIINKFEKKDGTFGFISCEVGPSCHSSPITSLQCIAQKYVLSSSRASTQYFDIENETLHLCENSVLRGFKCFGVTSPSNMTMLVRVCSPDRLLLQQNSFVKQMEISFLPFLSTDFIADHLANASIHLDITVREYVSLCAADQFILPDILHRYCDKPDTYDKSLHELQMYLYFNQLRYMQQTGMRFSSLTKEEVDADLVWTNEFDDPVIKKLDIAIAVHFFREMLSKCLQLLENGWVKETVSGKLALLLMADWLVQRDPADDALLLPKNCFSLLKENESLKNVEELKNREAVVLNSQSDIDIGKIENSQPKSDATEKGSTSENKDRIDTNPSNDMTSDINGKDDKIKEPDFCRTWDLPRENCPFCNFEVSLKSLSNVICQNEHLYFRCCLTLRIFMETNYRQCEGCCRKASPKRFDSELNIDSVLLNIDLCPFCGCRFIDFNR